MITAEQSMVELDLCALKARLAGTCGHELEQLEGQLAVASGLRDKSIYEGACGRLHVLANRVRCGGIVTKGDLRGI